MWPALSAVALEVASTGDYSRNGDTPSGAEPVSTGDLDLKFLQATGDSTLIGRLGVFDIKRVEGPIPPGKAKLAVTLDDGTTQSFDVTVTN